LLVFQLGQPRIFFSMARDGLLPKVFYKVHPKYRTPHISTILTGLFVGVFAAVASIDEMVDLTNIGTLFAFILVCAGIIVLRIKDPGRHRPFRVPGGLIIPVLGIISCLYLIYFLPPTSWLRFAAWLNLGFVIYVGYGSVKSRLTGKEIAANPAEHDAKTAYSGAWLGVVGTALLVFMRWFDLWLLANKDTERTVSAFAASLNVNSWLEHSVFMTVPLALNAFVLCPIIMKRALNAKRGAPEAGNPTASLAIAVILAVLTLAYLAMVFTHKG
jgi:amino acid transporter